MRKVFSTLLLTLLATAALAATDKLLTDVPLEWKPTSDLKELMAQNLGSSPNKLTLVLKDGRKKDLKNKVGENREDEKNVKPVTTSTDVVTFVQNNMKQILTKAGVEVVDSGAPFVLTGEITEYFVTETQTYNGSLIIKMSLTKNGKEVWKGVSLGTNKRFGRSYKLDNYMETLSDTLIECVTSLAENTNFKMRLQE